MYEYRLTISSTGNIESETPNIAFVTAPSQTEAIKQIYSQQANLTYAEGNKWVVFIGSQLVAHVTAE